MDQFHFRIVFENREKFRVVDQNGNFYPAEVSGKVRTGELWPAVGDWVVGTHQPGDWVQIVEVLQRKSILARKDPGKSAPQVLAANVDTLFIVTSANQDFSLNRLDRYVVLATTGNINPVILINKIELAPNAAELLDVVAERFPTTDVYGVSFLKEWNLECLSNFAFEGQTVAFVGSSGVGKSSLTNYLLGNQVISTQEIREGDDKGKHTTTHRELYVLPSGAVVIDTPGIRQVGLTDATDIETAYQDIADLSQQCRFTDCQHSSEPGCAIMQALNENKLSQSRWESYLRLEKEVAYERRKTDKALQSEEKKKWAKIHKDLRQKNKLRGK